MKCIIGIGLILIAAVAYSQPESIVFHSEFEKEAFCNPEPFRILLASDEQTDDAKFNAYESVVNDLVEKIKHKQEKLSDELLMEYVFFLIHRKQLSWYKNFVTLADVMETGNYDCLTGTAFYSVLLSSVGIPFTIYEFDYHVFLVAEVNNKKFLFESTDPYTGFSSDEEVIKSHISKYQVGVAALNGNQMNSIGNHQNTAGSLVFNQINLQNLTGLQYYNQALKAYNEKDLEKGRIFMEKALLLYPSKRMKEMSQYFQ